MIRQITDKNNWDKVLEEVGDFDCYHTYEYHSISKNFNEKAILVCYQKNGVTIALPLLKRIVENTPYFDCTSVYGYAGPIFSGNTTNADFEAFQEGLEEYCSNEHIVSIFSRLNPYIEGQEKPLWNLGHVKTLGNIVTLDLTKRKEEQRLAFSRTTKRYINKARKFCTIKKSSSKKDVDTFMELYYENMDRVNAEKQYYFDKTYFFNLLESNDFKTEFIYAVLEETNEIVSGIITIRSKKTIHYHLSGTRTKYLYLHPLRLLLDEVRIMASNDKFYSLNLGGGLGSKANDLFNYKSSFSKDVRKFKVWEYVVNKNVYSKLIRENDGNPNIFPAYRSKK